MSGADLAFGKRSLSEVLRDKVPVPQWLRGSTLIGISSQEVVGHLQIILQLSVVKESKSYFFNMALYIVSQKRTLMLHNITSTHINQCW